MTQCYYCTRGNVRTIWNGTMFADLDWPLNASCGFVSISWASCYYYFYLYLVLYILVTCSHWAQNPSVIAKPTKYAIHCASAPFGRTDLLLFLVGCCKRRLNQAPSVPSLSLGFFWCMCVVLLTNDSFLCCVIFMLFVCSVTWLFLLGCQYQCKWLTGKMRLRNDL